MSERRGNAVRRRRANDSSGALDDAPGTRSRVVNFSIIEIREFERVVGDNPSCSSGVPVSIGWNHGQTFRMGLEDFERARPPRRAQMDLVLTRGERHRLLVEWGASGQDVIEAIRLIIRVKNQRRQTVNNLGSYDRIEEVIERFSRQIKRVICQSSSNKAALKLQQESERAASLKSKPMNSHSLNSGEGASSTTANETASSPPPTARRGPNINKSKGRDPRPPCEEVNVMEDSSDDDSSNSDAGDMTPPSRKKPLRPAPPETSPRAKPLPISAAKANPVETAQDEDPDNGLKHDTDNDTDNMSNPQSHDHREVKAPATLQTANEKAVDL